MGQTKEDVTSEATPQQTVFSWRAEKGAAGGTAASQAAEPATHTVKVTVDGKAFSGSQDTFVSLDAVKVYPQRPVPARTPGCADLKRTAGRRALVGAS